MQLINTDDVWLWRWLAILPFFPFIPLLVMFVFKFPPVELFIGISAGMSLLVSVILSIIATKLKIKWVLVWWFAFLGFMPFANILFWLIHFRNLASQKVME